MQHPTLKHKLANGMNLLVIERHDVPVATADVWIATGSAHEPPHLAGVSHFLEHMLFKGTENWGLGAIERAIESVGGACNAGTSFDFTHYYVSLPSPHIEMAMEMLAEMVRRATLDGGELEKERMVILEEYRRKQDHPAGVLFERLYEELFERGPYHNTVIGSEETIKAIDRESMLDYYRRRYTPENITFVVAGDVDPDVIIQRCEALFADFTRPLEKLKPGEPMQLGAGKRIEITKPTGGEVYTAFAFPAPGIEQTEHVLPLDLAQYILGQGRASMLNQRLREKKGLCSSIGTYYPTHRLESLFVIVATCTPDQREALRRELIAELRAFASEAPAAAQMNRAHRLITSGHHFSQETSSGLATNAGYYFVLSGDTEFHDHYLDRLEAIDAARVHQSISAVIKPDAIEQTMVELAVGPNGQSPQ